MPFTRLFSAGDRGPQCRMALSPPAIARWGGPLQVRPSGRRAGGIRSSVHECFFIGELLNLCPRVSEPGEKKHSGGRHEEDDGCPQSRGGARDANTHGWYESRAAQGDRLDLAIVDQTTGLCVGEVVLNNWNEDDDTCNFRILIGPSGRNRGIGSEATRMVLGRKRAALKFDGEYIDTIIMSILRSDWAG